MYIHIYISISYHQSTYLTNYIYSEADTGVCRWCAFSPILVDFRRQLQFKDHFRAPNLIKMKSTTPKTNFVVSAPLSVSEKDAPQLRIHSVTKMSIINPLKKCEFPPSPTVAVIPRHIVL